MLHSIEWLRIFIFDHQSLEYIIIFFGTGFGGELALFTFAFLAAQGVMSIWILIILSFLGTFFSNILWFWLGKTAIVEKMISHRYANTTISVVIEAVARASKGNHSIAFTFIKFLFGTPVLLVMYLNKTKLNFSRFSYYESVAVSVSLLFYIPLGYLSGLGFDYLTDISSNLHVAIGFILCVLIIIIVIQIWLERIFTKKEA